MFNEIKEEFDFYKNCRTYGVIEFAVIHLIKIIAFPITLVLRLYKWIYYDD